MTLLITWFTLSILFICGCVLTDRLAYGYVSYGKFIFVIFTCLMCPPLGLLWMALSVGHWLEISEKAQQFLNKRFLSKNK